jgi:tRNA(Ile)-lysidine synthase
VSATFPTPPLTSTRTPAHTLLLGSAVPSPPSTVLFSQDGLARIKDPLIQRSMVIQILRFVSPHPWGSHTAEASRKSAGLDRIVASIFDNSLDKTSKKRFAFSAGSHVLWTPVYINPDGQFKRAKPVPGMDGWTEGWLASRSPPYRSAKGPSGPDIDITSLILDKKYSADHVEVLYDNRFILSFDLHSIPDRIFYQLRTTLGGYRLIVTSIGKCFLPRLVFRSSNGHDVEDIGISGPAPKVGPVTMVPEGDGHSPGAVWANWRSVRVFE